MKEPRNGRSRTGGSKRLSRPWVRVSVYGVLLSLAFGAWSLRSVSAEVSERALGLGRGLLALRDTIGQSTRLVVNGQELEVTNLRTELPLASVFERFAKTCRSDGAEPAQMLEDPGHVPAPASQLGVFQFQPEPNEGVIFCFAGAAADDYATLADKLARFAASGDLATMGQVRYLFGHEGDGRTTLLLVTSRGALDLFAMFPEDGDVPGDDLAPGVRPTGSVRALAVSAPETGHALAVYRGDGDPLAALRGYEAALQRAGFQVGRLQETHGAGGAPESEAMRVVTGADGLSIVSAGVVDGETVVSVIRLGGDGAPRRPSTRPQR